jgi:hypothetical protein
VQSKRRPYRTFGIVSSRGWIGFQTFDPALCMKNIYCGWETLEHIFRNRLSITHQCNLQVIASGCSRKLNCFYCTFNGNLRCFVPTQEIKRDTQIELLPVFRKLEFQVVRIYASRGIITCLPL